MRMFVRRLKTNLIDIFLQNTAGTVTFSVFPLSLLTLSMGLKEPEHLNITEKNSSLCAGRNTGFDLPLNN